jgi:hypothetical protein
VPYLVTDTPKDSQPRIWVTFDSCRIVKIPVNPFCVPGEGWTTLVSVIADGNYEVEVLVHKLINRFGSMLRDIYANLAHDLDRFRSHTAGFYTSTPYVKTITRVVAQ